MRARVRYLTVLAAMVAAGNAAPVVAQTPVTAPPNPDAASCEIHVWSTDYTGPPAIPKKSIFVKVIPAPQVDANDPLSFLNLYSTRARAATLSDDLIRRLLPDAASVTIVRHADQIDIRKRPLNSVQTPLTERMSECYGDLVVANLFAILGPVRATGVLPQLIAGNSRLVIDFWFQSYAGRGAKQFVVHRKNDSPLPEVANYSPEMREALTVSANKNLATFVEFVAQKRSH